MRSTFKILPYINKKRIKPDGTCAILCRVSIDGKNILITTGLTCRPEDWDSRKGTIRTARENNRLTEFRTKHRHGSGENPTDPASRRRG